MLPLDRVIRRFHESYAVFSVLDEIVQNLIRVVIELIDEGRDSATLKEIEQGYKDTFGEKPEWLTNRLIAHHLKLLGLVVGSFNKKAGSKVVLLTKQWRDRLAERYPQLVPKQGELET